MLLPDLPPSWLLAAFLTLLLLVALGAWRRAANRLSRASRRRQRVARLAEAGAEQLLARHGFTVLERQATRRWTIEVNGRREDVTCRADLVLVQGERLYVADVKSGERAPDPREPATRRQLLEYLLAFGASGVLVVDMTDRAVYQVSFPGLLDPG